ncbi:MAG TPA: hypothetical protein VFL93_10830 [Longimicrobiaceae bacterium]|nr:hypothetical protein [Longimicrobiaceae bacterium]
MSKMDEVIVVAPRQRVFDGESLAFHGFLPLSDPRAEAILGGLCESPYGARRGDVEEDESLLQPIPYVVVRRTGPAGDPEVFTYTRLTGGGERRLHGRVSVGVGGHMNRGFGCQEVLDVVAEEAARELAEELRFRERSGREAPPPRARVLGLINDDTGPVQRVHLGLLATVDVPAQVEVTVREEEQLEGSWRTLAELAEPELRERLEEWSLHALEGLAASESGIRDPGPGGERGR